MKAVNHVTQFLLKRMQEIETENKKVMLVDVYNSTKASAAESGLSEDEAHDAAMASAKLAVSMNIVMNLRELVTVVAKAGRVICELAEPDMVKDAGVELHSPEKLRAAAKEAGCGLGMLMQTLAELLPAVNNDIDEEHIVERLIEQGRKFRDAEKAAPADPEVKAKPVSGSAIPFGKRIEPSQN